MSKGSNRRPGDEQAYRAAYDRIFGRRSAPAVPPRFADQLSDEAVARIMAALYAPDEDISSHNDTIDPDGSEVV